MEEEARDILRTALARDETREQSLIEAIRARVAPLGGVDLELPIREPLRPALELEG
jgi:plasmid stability protein